MAERDVTNPLLVRASQLGARLFRQNTGLGWVGKIIRKTRNTITLENPRPLRAGLCVGSSDVIGWTPVTITADMVGRKAAIFTAIEIKTGKLQTTKEQAAFIRAVREAGGIARVARQDDDANDLLRW